MYYPQAEEKYIEQDKEEDTYFIPITETIEEQITDVKEIHDKTTSEAEDELEEPREYVKSPRPQLFSTHVGERFERKRFKRAEIFPKYEVDYKPGSTMFLSQRHYAENILRRFRMQDCHGVNTPMDINQKLSKLMSKEHVSPESPNFPYQEAIGTLLYLSQTSRPDICFEASFLSSFNQEPKGAHIKAVKRVMRYIQGTKDAKIAFDPDSKQGLVGYCDSDWANNVDNRRSVSGYIFMFQGGPISWASRRQKTVALSSCEAEYMALQQPVKKQNG
uniref:Reverse transcriptase Ty1/copia-type domain-containing protein n=1 Tax=Trichogramma kaykai TaxID=54128 RepID=A0ABD2WHA3_9HYME